MLTHEQVAALVTDIEAWIAGHGNPHNDPKYAKSKDPTIASLLTAIDPATGKVAERFLRQITPRVQVRDLIPAAQEEYTRTHRAVAVGTLAQRTGSTQARCVTALKGLGWLREYPADSWLPREDYLSGDLWPRVDALAPFMGEPQAAEQSALLQDALNLVEFNRIPLRIGAGWVPDEIIAQFVGVAMDVRSGLIKDNMLWRIANNPTPSSALNNFLCYLRNTRSGWSFPKKSEKWTEDQKRNAILEAEATYERQFRMFVANDADVQRQVELAYNRFFRGYVPKVYSDAPFIPSTRWDNVARTLKPHQCRAARKVLDRRGGLLALDVGVGKTDTGLAIIAAAKEQGWAKRPVLVVPNHIALKWAAKDIPRDLPDYNVGVIGLELYKGRGGKEKSRTDKPVDRTRKWREFQAGAYDMMVVAYTALPRTRLRSSTLALYAEEREAVLQQIALALEQERRKKKKVDEDEDEDEGGAVVQGLTVRKGAVIQQVARNFVERKLALPRTWTPDDVYWEDLGVDLMVIDEAQNFKNLYGLSRGRPLGIPKFVGAVVGGAARSWHMDVRCYLTRKRNNGGGVVLLSATPAKNSPIEFYSLLQYIDASIWIKRGMHDPEAFARQYLKEEPVIYYSTKIMAAAEGIGVTGFRAVEDLRTVLNLYGEFTTAEEAGLQLPALNKQTVYVTIPEDSAHWALYESVRRLAMDAAKNPKAHPPGAALAGLAQLAMITIHPDLIRVRHGEDDEQALPSDDQGAAPEETATDAGDAGGFFVGGEGVLAEPETKKKRKPIKAYVEAWKALDEGRMRPGSVKIDAVIDNILQTKDPNGAGLLCGHIVFCQNKVAHAFVEARLRERGFPAERIAVLNRDVAESIAKRQEIADAFNDGTYDVVIANEIAYEGVDLQVRTCGIHHLDLPWEPATLQQRNGRGYRQGNVSGVPLGIYHYLCRRTLDAMRYTMIDGKHAWIKDLLKSQDREITNPNAGGASVLEILAQLAENEEEARAHFDKFLAEVAVRKFWQLHKVCSGLLESANGVFMRSKAASDADVAARLWRSGESLLRELAEIRAAELTKGTKDPYPLDAAIAECSNRQLFIYGGDLGTVPMWEGMTYGHPLLGFFDIGRVSQFSAYIRRFGESTYEIFRISEKPGDGGQEWHHWYMPSWVGATGEDSYDGNVSVTWTHASDAFLDKVWNAQTARRYFEIAGGANFAVPMWDGVTLRIARRVEDVEWSLAVRPNRIRWYLDTFRDTHKVILGKLHGDERKQVKADYLTWVGSWFGVGDMDKKGVLKNGYKAFSSNRLFESDTSVEPDRWKWMREITLAAIAYTGVEQRDLPDGSIMYGDFRFVSSATLVDVYQHGELLKRYPSLDAARVLAYRLITGADADRDRIVNNPYWRPRAVIQAAADEEE